MNISPVVVSVASGIAWFVIHMVASAIGYRMPDARFASDTWLYRERPFEHGGRVYERWLIVKRWKHKLPKGDALVKDAFHKDRLQSSDPMYLRQFIIESRRAEFVHWLAAAPAPLFFAFGNVPLGLAMVAYAVLANAPCVIAQRYNRIRLMRVLAVQLRRAERQR